jgi:hypothetical protein
MRKTRGLTRSVIRLDGAALAGSIAALEDDAHLQPLVYHPLLQLDQLHMQLGQFLVVKLPGYRGKRFLNGGLDFCFSSSCV